MSSYDCEEGFYQKLCEQEQLHNLAMDVLHKVVQYDYLWTQNIAINS